MLAESPAPGSIVSSFRPILFLAALSLTLAACGRERSAAEDAETASIAPDSVETDAPSRDFRSVAAKVVQQSAGVGEDEIVMIFGSDEDVPLLEDIAIEVRKVGGHPFVSATTRGLERRTYDEVPAKYDSQTPRVVLGFAEMADVFISTESGEGRTLKGVAPERMAARAKAFQPVLTRMQERKVRSVALGNGLYPSAERAEQFGISREALADMMYAGVDADYSRIQATGERLRGVLAGGKELRITNPSGTDLRVRIAGRPVVVSDGVISPEDRKKGGPAVSVWLPAGEVFLTPVPGTANGVVVADRLFYQGDRIEGLRLELKGGKMVGMTAKSGLEALEKFYAVAGPGKDVFGVVDIGINPGIEVPEGGAVNVWARAGAVTVVVGNNAWAGGDNRSNFSINPEIANATLEVDGTALVKDGRLVESSAVANR
jgi:leucyl aminopeptidase (aminopeptidase T)